MRIIGLMNSTSAIRKELVIRSGLRHQDALSYNTPALLYFLPQGPFSSSSVTWGSIQDFIGTGTGKRRCIFCRSVENKGFLVALSESVETRTPYFNGLKQKGICIKCWMWGKKEKMATYDSRQFPPRASSVLVLQNHSSIYS